MAGVLLLDHAGSASRHHVDDVERALNSTLQKGRPVLVQHRSGMQVPPGKVPWAGLDSTPQLVLTLDNGDPLSGRLSSSSPEEFGRLGLCSWKATTSRVMVPEPHWVDVPPVILDQPAVVASLVCGLVALIDGRHCDALDQLGRVAAAGVLTGRASFYQAYWIALAHLDAGQCLGDTAHFEAGGRHLISALDRRGSEVPNVVVAAVYRTLAQTHYQRPAADPEEECSIALGCIEQGLSLLDPTPYPVDRACLLYERASVNLYRPMGKDVATAGRTRRDLTEALEVFEPRRFPLEYSQCHNALGRLDAEGWGKDRWMYQRSAASHFAAALRVRRKRSHPWHFAQTQHNLGNLFLQRLAGGRSDNADRAIRCFTQALSVFDQDRFPHRRRQSLAALGRAYAQRNANAGADLRLAVSCFEEVAASVTAESFPYLYGRTLFDLGNVLHQSGSGGGPALTIDRYRQALQIFSADRFPVDRAHVLVALAGALTVLAEGGAEAWSEALACYGEALDVFERINRPADAACVHACLALLLFALRSPVGGSAHALASGHQQTAQALVTSGVVREAGGDGVEAYVLAILRDSVEIAGEAAADCAGGRPLEVER